MKSKAREYRALRLREAPVSIGTGRVEALFQYLIPVVPPSLVKRHQKGNLAVVGVDAPRIAVHAEQISPTDDVIEMSQNYMRFLYAFIRTLAGRCRIDRSPTDFDPSVITVQTMLDHMESLLQAWKSGEVFGNGPFVYEYFALYPSQINLAETLTLFGELFSLAHEIGHVVVRHQLEDHITLPGDLPNHQAEELWADGFAMRCALRVAEPNEIRYALAGAHISLRIFDFLERIGGLDDVAKPPIVRRIAFINETARKFFANEQSFAFSYHFVEAFERFLEMTESKLLMAKLPPLTADRLVITLLAVSEERARDRLAEEAFTRRVASLVNGASKAVMMEVVQILHSRYLYPEAQTQPCDPMVEQSVDMLLRVLKELNVLSDKGEFNENLHTGYSAE